MKEKDKTKEQLIEELEKLHQELRLYKMIVEKMPLALTVWELEDLDNPGSFRLLACNPQIEKATGAPYRELVGTTVRETFPSSLETEGPHLYADAVRAGQVRELPDLRFPGDEQTAAGVYSVTVIPLGGRIAAIFCENITERKQAEEALELKVKQLATLSQASQAVTASLELDQVLAEIASLASEVIASDYAGVVLVDEAGHLGRSAETLPGVPAIEYRVRDEGLTSWIIRSRQAVIIEEIGEDGAVIPSPGEGAPRFANPLIVKAGIKSVAGLPLIVKGRLLGVLYLRSLHSGAFHGQLPLLTTFGNQAAIAVENARLYEKAQRELTERKRAEEEIKQRNRELAALNAITASIMESALDLDEVLQRTADGIVEGLGCNTAFIFLLDEEEEVFKGSAVSTKDKILQRMNVIIGFPLLQIEIPARSDFNEAMSNLLDGRPTIQHDFYELVRPLWSKPVAYAMQRLLDSRTFFTMPLIAKGKTVGGIVASTREELSEGETEKLMTFANQAAIAIENARLYDAIQQELTERKRAEEALRESEEKLKEAQALGRIGNWEFDVDNQKIDWSDETYRLYERDPAFGPPTVQEEAAYYAPEQAEKLREYAHRAIEEGEGFKYDLQAKLPSGKPAHFSATMRPVRDESGRVVKLFGTVQDITERKRAEEELRASEQRYRLLFERNLAGVYRSTLDGRILDCNESYARIFGYDSQEEVLALRTSELYFDAADRETFIARLREQGTLTNSEWCLRRKDDSPVWVLENASLIEGEEDGPTFIQGTLVDITERKRAERLLQGLNQAALAMRKAMRPEEIFAVVASELKKLGFSCIVFLTDESQSRLLIRYFSYEARAIDVLEKLTGLKIENFSIPIETTDVYRKVVWERRAAFIDNVEDVTRQFLPKPLKKFTGQIVKMLKIAKSIPAPLVVEDEVIGLFSVESDDLTEDDIPAITAFAHQMAAAWRKAQLIQDLERSLIEQKQAREELRQSFEKLHGALEGTVNVLASAIETRDPYTAGHQRRVTQLACAIAEEMGLPEEQVEGLRVAGLIHDIGKISVPAEILSKPGRLNNIEYGLIKAHPQIGHDILKTVEFPWPVAQIVLQHHERMDGSGYPQGLSGGEITLEARILAVADVVEAMASHRPYRPSRGIDLALEEISQNRGVLYDSEVVDACLKLFAEKGFEFE